MTRVRRATRFGWALALATVLVACGSGSEGEQAVDAGSPGAITAEKQAITVATFNFGESQILGAMYAEVLEQAGYEVRTRPNLGARDVVFPALEKGEVDLVPEYVGTLTEFLNKAKNGPDAKPLASSDLAATVSALRTLAAEKNLAVLEPSPAADQNAFAVKSDFAAQNGLSKLSDLVKLNGRLVLGGPPECPTRPFCQPGLEKTYGLKFAKFVALDPGGPLTKSALEKGQINVGLVFSSDGGIEARGFTVLADDKKLQTVDNVVPVGRVDKLTGDARTALDRLSATLTTADLIRLNKAVDIDKEDPEDVAHDYLADKGLV